MGEKIVIGPINKGLNTSRTPFVIDNDSFPVLQNSYQWRGRVKRKRGTSFLGRLTRFFNSTISSYSPSHNTIVLGAGGSGNLLTSFATLQTNATLVAGNITIVDSTNGLTYTDDSNGNLINSSTILGSVNYITGAFLITGRAGDTVSVSFNYYPDLPVLGIEDFTPFPTQFPGTILFDDVYSYSISTASPYPIHDVSFYKNPASSGSYVQKTNPTPTTWNGNDYQQFWTTNYQGALWATNGIPIPFVSTNIGMQFQKASGAWVNATTITFTMSGATNLVIGDFVFANEFTASTAANAATLNFQTGYVTNVVGTAVTVVFPSAMIANDAYSNGILQFLTNRSNTSIDCLRYYDGDPTNGNSTNPTLTPGNGWVNFAPPISQSIFSIGDLPAAQYYLVGARMIIPFKDRILFLGVVVANSGNGVFYLQDTIVYSQNGTPYYTASFTGSPTAATTIFTPALIVPANQTATASAYFSDSTGFGGFVTAGLDQPITTASFNEDVIIIGFSTTQTRLVYSGSDIVPFNFYYINSEYGSASPFSSINFDKGVVTRGTRGFILTSQTNCNRIDLDIPDQVFEINLTQNGNERLCAARDFINEWIYFTYPENNDSYRYPNQTLMWNYRDNSWAIFYESYTTYGQFRRQTGFIWSTVGLVYPSWSVWNEPWNAGDSTLLQTEVLAGNQQGFIISRDEGTGEATSLYISALNSVTGVITSPDHNLVSGDYIIISGVLGAAGALLNGKTFSVHILDANTFTLNPPVTVTPTYIGGGLITKIYVPFIQTKQFPTAWGMSRKTRLGPQQYLLSTTANSQITLLIYLSQDSSNPYNQGAIVPAIAPTNSSLIYSTVLYTCPESTNLGLTPANINLQMVTASQQAQIWHRINTSLIGDTVQLAFTLSDDQIRSDITVGPPFAITGATNAYPCVLTTTAADEVNQLVLIQGVVGMTQLNGNIYQVISSTSTTVTINVDSTLFGSYISGGTATQVAGLNSFAEIELHGIILDVNPSQVLS
jgi:hypothetical protein